MHAWPCNLERDEAGSNYDESARSALITIDLVGPGWISQTDLVKRVMDLLPLYLLIPKTTPPQIQAHLAPAKLHPASSFD